GVRCGRARGEAAGGEGDRDDGGPVAVPAQRWTGCPRDVARARTDGVMPGVPVTRGDEPAYAGAGATFSKLPLALTPEQLEGADVAIVGAPTDDAVTYRPGARFGPKAIRLADVGGGPHRPHMDLGVNAFDVLTVVDYGD